MRRLLSDDLGWTRVPNVGFKKSFDREKLPHDVDRPLDLKDTYCHIDSDNKIYKIISALEEFYKFELIVEDPLISVNLAPVEMCLGNYDLEGLVENLADLSNKGYSRVNMTEEGLAISGSRYLEEDELIAYRDGLFEDE